MIQFQTNHTVYEEKKATVALKINVAFISLIALNYPDKTKSFRLQLQIVLCLYSL